MLAHGMSVSGESRADSHKLLWGPGRRVLTAPGGTGGWEVMNGGPEGWNIC